MAGKMTREARVRQTRKRHSVEEQAIEEQLRALSDECWAGDRFCGDVLLYSAFG